MSEDNFFKKYKAELKLTLNVMDNKVASFFINHKRQIPPFIHLFNADPDLTKKIFNVHTLNPDVNLLMVGMHKFLVGICECFKLDSDTEHELEDLYPILLIVYFEEKIDTIIEELESSFKLFSEENKNFCPDLEDNYKKTVLDASYALLELNKSLINQNSLLSMIRVVETAAENFPIFDVPKR